MLRPIYTEQYTKQNRMVANPAPLAADKAQLSPVGRPFYGVPTKRWTLAEINGDQQVLYQRQGIGYVALLWAVSLWALLTNGTRLLLRKAKNRHRFSLPQLLWQLGRDPNHYSSLFVDRFSHYNHQAKVGAAGVQALDLFYHYPTKVKPRLSNDLEGRLTRFWIERMHNRQAVSIRLALATDLIAAALQRYRHEPVVRILSIATGSTEAIIRAIHRSGVRNVEVIVLDNHGTALDAIREQVEKADLLDHFTFVQGTTRRLDALCVGRPPHMIEMIGFLDYRPDDKAVALVRKIYEGLAPGGTFFTGNIHPNPERVFLDWVLLWPMIYRTADQLTNLLISGDFQAKQIQLHYEPFGIHAIAVCQKESPLCHH